MIIENVFMFLHGLMRHTFALPVLDLISSTAEIQVLTLRDAMITSAPILANSLAATRPMPLLPPVIITTLPSISESLLRRLDDRFFLVLKME